ncbi:hypothetical protein FQA47_021367 [Oryzias melastigma]|uniref:Uncharacterized protein n=1 Tax=Oryzias melastigma TaxID=30732 RepID=A0A834CEU2_ORYME|nr:hypothetical protein FQA47_021367 [Oryzias melastigma]
MTFLDVTENMRVVGVTIRIRSRQMMHSRAFKESCNLAKQRTVDSYFFFLQQHRLYHDADIPDRDHSSELLARIHKLHLQYVSEGSKSSESSSSEESSEETKDTTEEPIDPLVLTTVPMTTLTSGDGDTLPPEPGMNSTEPTMMPELETISLFMNGTTTCTSCFTEEIGTAAPVTDNRGDT